MRLENFLHREEHHKRIERQQMLCMRQNDWNEEKKMRDVTTTTMSPWWDIDSGNEMPWSFLDKKKKKEVYIKKQATMEYGIIVGKQESRKHQTLLSSSVFALVFSLSFRSVVIFLFYRFGGDSVSQEQKSF